MLRKFEICATLTLIALCLTLVPVHGGEPKPELRIQDAWALPAATTGMTGQAMGSDMKEHSMKSQAMGSTSAVYLTLVNTGDGPDALVAASSDAASAVELHETRMKGNIMRMVPIPRVEVPARGRREFKPGGLHLMLIGLKRDLKPGDRVKMTLRFEKSGTKTLTARVRRP